jgi:CubicO group peptidase (beta-lactamase class C family)
MLTGALASPVAATPRSVECGPPRGAWQEADPEDVALDPDKLEEALNFARPRNSQEIAVYRNGCLVAARRWEDGTTQFEGYSISKSVTAMAVGRAVTLGLLRVGDPIGRHVPEAEGRHARITVEQLLTQTSGLYWNFWRDYNIFMRDRVADALSLPFDHKPGKFFEYMQSPVALLAHVVEQAAGEDFQDFIQRELLGPVGIRPGDWFWVRDGAGNTEGYKGFNTTVDNFARLGYLMLNDGRWGSRRLITPAYAKKAVSPTRTNRGYGYLFWLNGRGRYVNPTVYSRDERRGPAIKSAPRDMYYMAGFQDQRTYVIPSLNMVVVRVGGAGSREPDTRSSVFTSAAGEFEHEFFRLLMKAVTDVRVKDPGPYEYSDPLPDPDPNYGIVKSTTEPEHILAGFGLP